MAIQEIRFNDGAAYDQGMGRWSRLAGEIFVDWLAPRTGLRWIDVGCGSGVFTSLAAQRCAPADIHGVDPSEAQLAFARTRSDAGGASFQLGDAMALPFPDDRFDVAVMALVIFFVPDPAKGVAEMARVVQSGGFVAAYAWDIEGGGFPFHPIQAELRALGTMPLLPPSVSASRMEEMHALWTAVGLEAIETRDITVRRTFDDFNDYWAQSTTSGVIRPALAAMSPADLERLKQRVRARMSTDDQGRVTHSARANAVKGRMPIGE